jgi:short-subunit dehydrogenase
VARGVAVVTGASSGIGEATARELTARGWSCVLLARREERLRAVAASLPGAEAVVCDVAAREEVERVAAEVLARHPRIELLVNNAGIPARMTFADPDPALVEEVLRVNYLGSVWCARAFLPGLRAAATASGEAHVANVVSVAGTVAFAPAGPYAASKHAQLAFSRSLAAVLAREGIRVHTILPGFVETEGFPQAAMLANPLMRRFVITPERVARALADAVERNRREMTVPWFPYRLATLLQAVAPGLVARVVTRTGYRAAPEEP